MTSIYDIQLMDRDFNLENTINENIALKKNKSTLGIILVTVVAVAVISIVIINNTYKSLYEEAKQRV